MRGYRKADVLQRRLGVLLSTIFFCANTAYAVDSAPTKIFRSGNARPGSIEEVHIQRGFALTVKDELEDAAREFNASRNILLASDEAIIFIGKTFERSGEYSVAIEILTKFIEYAKTASPPVSGRNLGQALKFRGDAYSEQHLYAPAYADYMKDATVDPTDAGYDYRMAAECCTKQKKFDEALK